MALMATSTAPVSPSWTVGVLNRARMVYVWERMWDVVDRDTLLRSVLDRSAALRLAPAH